MENPIKQIIDSEQIISAQEFKLLRNYLGNLNS